MNFAALETYEVLERKEVKIVGVLEFHMKRLTSSIHRKLSFKQKFVDPWVINISEYISKEVYYEFFRAVRDYKISYGRTCEIVRSKKNEPKEYVITFVHYGCLRFHLSKVIDANVDIDAVLSKSDAIGNKAKVIVDDADKKAIMHYKISTGELKLKLHYEVKNKFGNICSF